MPRRGLYFFLLAQEMSKQKEGHPVRRSPCRVTPLRCSPRRAQEKSVDSNSRDPLRGHALRHESADSSRRGCATRRLAGAPKTTTSPMRPFRYTELSYI